ncbi:WD40 repeat domain-containing protein [Vogesella sp. GCM10023246]|uniref:Anaphase-promoting complex subunit 4 WD40 domain-containing protein n=1 Tax=Vogesella oryzagri TaxID=3160864 RepID=A0ABV1M1M4_9NEIS
MKIQLSTMVKISALPVFISLCASYYFFANDHPALTKTLKQWQPKPNHPAIVALNRDSTRLAVANVLSNEIRIFSVPSFDLLRIIKKQGGVSAISFAPDGKTLAAGSEFSRLIENRNSIRLWNSDTGALLWEPAGFIAGKSAENDVNDLVFSPNGKNLLVSMYSLHPYKKCCYLFLIKLEKKSISGFGTSLSYSVSYSRNGRRIVSGGFGGLQIWSATGGGAEWEQTLQNKKNRGTFDPFMKLAFSNDGSELLVVNEKGAKIHSAATGIQTFTLPIESKNIRLATYSPDGRYIVAASNRLFIFDAISKVLLEESALPKSANSISFDGSGRKFAVGTDSGYVVIKEFLSN